MKRSLLSQIGVLIVLRRYHDRRYANAFLNRLFHCLSQGGYRPLFFVRFFLRGFQLSRLNNSLVFVLDDRLKFRNLGLQTLNVSQVYSDHGVKREVRLVGLKSPVEKQGRVFN